MYDEIVSSHDINTIATEMTEHTLTDFVILDVYKPIKYHTFLQRKNTGNSSLHLVNKSENQILS